MKRKKTWLEKLESKFGKYAVPNLMKYLTGLYIVYILISLVAPNIRNVLDLDFARIFKGEIWRLVGFIMFPPALFTNVSDFILLPITLYLYYFIGTSLEYMWGTFKFNLFYFAGVIACILSALIAYFVLGSSEFAVMASSMGQSLISTTYIFQTMFLAYALTFPEQELLLFFILPIKVKWIGIFYGVLMGADLFRLIRGMVLYSQFRSFYLVQIINMVLCLMNFIVLLITMKRGTMVPRAQKKRNKEFKKKVHTLGEKKHVCTTCGISSVDNPDMEFRYCSRCDGNKEYCMDHLFTHEHVRKIVINIDKDSDEKK